MIVRAKDLIQDFGCRARAATEKSQLPMLGLVLGIEGYWENDYL